MAVHRDREPVEIASRDYWVKVVEMLQQNWALVDPASDGARRVYFVSDASGVFDQLDFATEDEAVAALQRNGFRQYAANPDLNFLKPPSPPFSRHPHPNGAIYSSGRYWR